MSTPTSPDTHSASMTLTDSATAPVDGEKGVTTSPSAGDVEKQAPAAPAPPTGSGGPGLAGFPEGGLRGWLNVAGAFLVLFSSFGYTNAFGVYESYYLQNQLSSETDSNISWIGSIQLWCMFSAGIFAGPLFDAGYFRHLMAVGSVFTIIGVFMTSLTKEYYQVLLAQGFCLGIGQGMLFLPAISVLGHYFMKRRSLAMGLAVVGSSVGGICFPIMLNNLLNSIGFAKGVQATGYLIMGCLIIANVIMSPRLPPRKKGAGPPPPNPFTFFKEPRYAFAVSGAFFVAWGLFFPFFYLQVFAESYHVSENISFYSLSILNAASVFGRTIPNMLSDKFGPINLLLPCIAGSAILVFAMFGATNPGGVVVFAILYGFFSGGYVSIISPMFVSMANHPGEIGVRIGLAFCIIGLAALTGTPISGALLARTNQQFYAPIIFSGVVIGVGFCLMLAARFCQAKVKGTWKV